MKKISLFSVCLLLTQIFFAQQNPLPDCSTITTELTTIKESFGNILEKFASEKGLFPDEYKSNFSVCGEKGKLTDSKFKVEFRFSYGSYNYKGGKEEFNVLFEKILKSINEVFGKSYDHEKYEKDTNILYKFYEKGSFSFSSKKRISLSFTISKAGDGKISYYVSLIFENNV